MSQNQTQWRIVAVENYITGNTVGFDILFKKEFPAGHPDEAKATAMRIIRKSPVARTFTAMRNWRYANKRRMVRRRKDRRPYELILLSLEKDIYQLREETHHDTGANDK